MKNFISIFFQRLDYIIRTPKIKIACISMIGIMLFATALLSFNLIGVTYSYNLGDLIAADIRITRDIHYTIQAETDIQMERASESVPLVFDKNASVLIERLQIIRVLFNKIHETLVEIPPIGTDNLSIQLRDLKLRLPNYIRFSDATLLELMGYRDPAKLQRIIFNILIRIYDDNDMGMLDVAYSNPLNIPNKSTIMRVIDSIEDQDEISKNLDDYKTIGEMKKNAGKLCYAISPNLSPTTMQVVIRIISGNLYPNISFNQEETYRSINQARKNVKMVKGVLKKGHIIAREGDTVTADLLNKITIINRYTQSAHSGYVIGVLGIQFLFLLIFAHFLLEYHSTLIPDKKSTIIISTLLIVFIIYTFGVGRSLSFTNSEWIFVFLLPIPCITMLLSILYNKYISAIVGIYLVFFTSLMSGGDFRVVIIAFSTAVVGVFVNSNVEKRTDFLMGGLLVGFVNVLVLLTLVLIEETPFMNGVRILHYAFFCGFINSILALGILPIYENIFGITTKFKLLELSDLNAEIFKKMLMKAPGTYNHSLIVSTMAEAACKDIHANNLLARVGSYYHDIGKIDDAGMYIENRITDPRAEKMEPVEYSKLIIDHVRKGVEIAQYFKLPQSVVDFIQEHHGKSTMTYFYHQALEMAYDNGENAEIDKTNFQYPGPKPHSKETAIVMLADAIEAASRSLQEPTPVKLEGLVRKIIYNKLNDGELEYSDLSMTELNIVQKVFLRILNGIFHTRLEYPDKKTVEKLEEKVQTKYEENRNIQ